MGIPTRPLGLSLVDNGGGGQSNWPPLRHVLPQLHPLIAAIQGLNGLQGATVVASNGGTRGVVMKTAYSKLVWTIGLMGVSAAALADEAPRAHPQEPVGFFAGGVIGAFAAGPIGAIVGAGLGTWLGNRVHRASEASLAEAKAAALQGDKSELQTEKSSLVSQNSQLLETNQSLSAKLDDLSQKVVTAQSVSGNGAEILDGLEGDVLFRTGSAEITPDIAHQIQVLAQAVAKSPALKVRVDGYADPRGTEDSNMKLSQDRANAVRDLLLAAGVSEEDLEINAYGKTQSVAADSDGFALERRVRLTLQAQGGAAVAQVQD
jgi:outer membrane protein OmpA-like peptidoglycan-associated protein